MLDECSQGDRNYWRYYRKSPCTLMRAQMRSYEPTWCSSSRALSTISLEIDFPWSEKSSFRKVITQGWWNVYAGGLCMMKTPVWSRYVLLVNSNESEFFEIIASNQCEVYLHDDRFQWYFTNIKFMSFQRKIGRSTKLTTNWYSFEMGWQIKWMSCTFCVR